MTTEDHFETWLKEHVKEDIRDQVRKLMQHEYNHEPDIYDRVGWTRCYDNIEHLIIWPKE